MPIINSVIAGGGTTPTGTKNITTNGTHDVAAYEYADVQVPTTAPTYYKEFVIDANGKAINQSSYLMNFNGITDVSDQCFTYLYHKNTNITGLVDLSSLINISGVQACYYMFDNCTGITSVDLSSLTKIGSVNSCGYMFQNCTGIISADLSSLSTIVGTCPNMFQGCTNLLGINLSSLTTISSSSACQTMFSGCSSLASADVSSLTKTLGSNACNHMFAGTALTSVSFSSLTQLTGSGDFTAIFNGTRNLASLYFPSITPNSFGSYVNTFVNMCLNVTNVTIHFPSNTQAKIETLTGYSATAPFGAVAGTVLFDLPATYTLTGADTVTYTRNPKYDTATALAWKVGAYGTTNFTPAYYTSGTSDPQANDTIYSDAACTTAVTTISAIA